METIIKNLKAEKILDSRGNPTVQVTLETNSGIFKGATPSGASIGRYEAVSIDYNKAIENVEIIEEKIKGKPFKDQRQIDEFLINLDGTKDKSKLGVNSILPISIAFSRALSASQNLNLYEYLSFLLWGEKKISFPRPCFNILNGGKHAENNLSVQEFMVLPTMDSFKENLSVGEKIYLKLSKALEGSPIGDEGGFAPSIKGTEEALNLLVQAIEQSGYNAQIGLDCAATEFYTNGKYVIDGKKMDAKEIGDFYKRIIKKYPIILVEDPFSQDDYMAWQTFFDNTINIIGDDLIATNINRIKKAKEENLCNGIIVKPNQIGTVTETLEAIKLAKDYGWNIVISHRSGETMDSFIADLAVGSGAEFIKSGAPGPKERMAKYNRLLEIEKYEN